MGTRRNEWKLEREYYPPPVPPLPPIPLSQSPKIEPRNSLALTTHELTIIMTNCNSALYNINALNVKCNSVLVSTKCVSYIR